MSVPDFGRGVAGSSLHGVGRTDKLVSRTSICNINRAQMMMQMAARLMKSDLKRIIGDSQIALQASRHFLVERKP